MGDLYSQNDDRQPFAMGHSETPLVQPGTSRAASRTFVVGVASLAAVLAIAAVIGFTFWQSRLPNSDGLADRVLDSMNQSFANDEQFRDAGVHAESITVLHLTGNMFEGQAELVNKRGKRDSASVHISYDGETLLWRTDPGSFMEVLTDQFGL